MMGMYGMLSSRSGWGIMIGFGDHGNERLRFIKCGELIYYLGISSFLRSTLLHVIS
jgi:hypothetical protein